MLTSPTDRVQFLDRIYGRALFGDVKDGERWFREINLGSSWSPATEVTISSGVNNCNSVTYADETVTSILATMDNSTCDGDGEPIIVRWVASVRENDIQDCTEVVPPGEKCTPFAALTVLTQKRKGYQIYYGDELENAYQSRVILNKKLP